MRQLASFECEPQWNSSPFRILNLKCKRHVGWCFEGSQGRKKVLWAKSEREWGREYLRAALGSVCVTDFLVSFRCWAPVRSLSSLEAALTLRE